LTGLFNRRKVETHLKRQIKEGRSSSVIYLDLNGFKRINDTLGHLAGDDLLKQFAGELRTTFRAADVVGRWGGDEFVVVVDGDSQKAKACLARIEQWVSGEYTLTTADGPKKIKLAVAAGIATWKPGESITDVLRNADAAMYAEKSRMKSVQR
jgi:diguanylate cyclase